MSDDVRATADLPAMPGRVARDPPDIWSAYPTLEEAYAQAGPSDDKAKCLAALD